MRIARRRGAGSYGAAGAGELPGGPGAGEPEPGGYGPGGSGHARTVPGGPLVGGAPTAPAPDSGGVLSQDAPVPGIRIQLNALQALCRQVFGFRLAMIALGAPFALSRAADGVAGWLVGGAIVVTVLVSYALLRDWERFGPAVLRHPVLLGGDVLFLALLLLTATPNSPVGYATVSTPLLAGLLYGWRGAGIFTGLQLLVLAAAYSAWADRLDSPASTLLLAGFCVAAGVVGVTLRNLMFHFGTASQALTEARARIAVGEAVESERARLAREMHDSVAKTLHGLALAADGLASSADRTDPATLATLKQQAEQVARSARQAAAESRDILADLRQGAGFAGEVDLTAELGARVEDFAARTGLPATFRVLGAPGAWGAAPSGADAPAVSVPPAVARQALAIAAEAMENAHRHAAATRLTVAAGPSGSVYRLSVYDDGRGLPPHTELAALRRAGHFGLMGMVERAAQIGARIRIGRGRAAAGTEVRLELPLAAITRPPPGDAPYSTSTSTSTTRPPPPTD
ncbi:two-component sensor histidine kinase [Streptomyces armeniacus]|uniref:Two-component sensor histidine kinase n=1 Tax=Streptomyces armeniacus TaxID=83291 RepID=A0A345XYG4_9ACTN|nr:histidine kinase [Streptomyces armeniacus]AXK36680.1 two-component sensor histidine kinase [Streptomyces armeniacus]